MKIVVVQTSLAGGGAEYVGRTWMAQLALRGHEVHGVLTGKPVNLGLLPPGVTGHTLHHHRGNAVKSRALRDLLREVRPDAVVSLQSISNLIAFGALAMLRSSRPKHAVSERNLVTLGLAGSSLQHRAKTALTKRLYSRADLVLAISHPVAAELVAAFGVHQDRLAVLPNPVSDRRHAGIANGPRSNDQQLNLVLTCRLVQQKQPLLAVETARRLKTRGVDTKLTCFGDGPLREQLIDAASAAGVTLDMKGWVDDWTSEVPATESVLLLPSQREGLGNVLVEAGASGVPVVAPSTALGVADAIVPGVTGELALSAHPDDLVEAVLAAHTIESAPPAGWIANFSAAVCGERLERLLERMVGPID
ncbi:glycosyltransferase [Nocardioides zeae]|uniref:Glycosyltransferase n=1 Tax=Nocardioides imazamoxiresistens TaxID=3231893 RepID=A0ABU3PWJ2_9ACTN|nr:glycosyltransferase [Nocardioides zeae]MDT9593566.1 glycosyltransferase [Nocardioides zeae]